MTFERKETPGLVYVYCSPLLDNNPYRLWLQNKTAPKEVKTQKLEFWVTEESNIWEQDSREESLCWVMV
jgi:hypothetical protein